MGRTVAKENFIAGYSFRTNTGGENDSVHIEVEITAWIQFEAVIMKIGRIQSIELTANMNKGVRQS